MVNPYSFHSRSRFARRFSSNAALCSASRELQYHSLVFSRSHSCASAMAYRMVRSIRPIAFSSLPSPIFASLCALRLRDSQTLELLVVESKSHHMRGLIGVVGPTRMDYATVAARLTGFADGLTKLFGKQEKQELPPKEDTDT